MEQLTEFVSKSFTTDAKVKASLSPSPRPESRVSSCGSEGKVSEAGSHDIIDVTEETACDDLRDDLSSKDGPLSLCTGECLYYLTSDICCLILLHFRFTRA